MADQYVWIYYYLTYTDPTEYAAALALNGGDQQVQLAPSDAAAAFPTAALSCPWPYPLTGTLSDPTSTLSLLGPSQANGPPDSSTTYTPDSIRVGDAQTNVVVEWSPDPYGDPPQTTDHDTYVWVGVLTLQAETALAPSPTPVPPAPPPATVYVGARRWVEGFEVPPSGAGATGSVAYDVSRDASRTSEGFGFAYRSLSATDDVTRSAGASHPHESWERFYVRLRTLPSAEQNLWACIGSAQSGAALVLNVETDGTVKVYNLGNAAWPGTLIYTSTSPFGADTWVRVDLHFTFATGAGQFAIYLNGTQDGSTATVTGSDGLASSGYHASSKFGNVHGTTNGLEADLDDWIGADPITVGGGPAPGLDLNSGSHVFCLRATGLASDSSVDWTGDWREVLANPVSGALATAGVHSTTASAKFAVTTDYADQQIGCAAFTVGVLSQSTSAVTAQLGYAINGSETLASIALTQNAWSSVLYTVPDNTAEPLPRLTSVNLVFEKDGGAGGVYVNALLGSAELLGVFGSEDVAPGQTYYGKPRQGVQNAPYPVFDGPLQPPGEVVVSTGTYTGNNVGQDILQKYAAHWVWIRPLSGQADGVSWYPSLTTAHGYLATGASADRLPQAVLSAAGADPLWRTSGPAGAANATGTTYQYVAVSDPSGRFLRLKAFAHAAALASAVNTLDDTGFTPQAAFLFVEAPTGSTADQYYKGAGHATDTASKLNGSASSGIATFGLGTITSQAAIHTANPQTAAAAWRDTDNHGTQGVLAIVSYTGTGAAQTIALPTLNGNTPVFVLVVPHNGSSYFRDPSHTGTHSCGMTLGDTTTGITGLANGQCTVGTTLSSLGVVYDVFALAGNPNGGTGLPVIPQPGPSGPYPPPPTPQPPLDAGCISLFTAMTELANRLSDPGMVHWTAAELQRYLFEALRAWNALTRTYRGEGSFTAVASQAFYDLPTELPSLLGNILLDQDVVQDIEYALMEPPTPSAWTGTGQFTLAMLTQAIQRRRDQFLRETGIQLNRQTSAITVAASGRVALPPNVITVRRTAWVMADGTVVPMFRDDEWALDAFFPTWNQTPVDPTVNGALSFSIGVTPPLTAQLAPPPAANGTLDLVGVVLGAALDPATGVLLGVPDDFAWIVKFGALADLLAQAGTAWDLTRVAICKDLWALGVEAASRAAVVLVSKIGSQTVQPDTLADADKLDPSWQTTLGAPASVLVASGNLVALAPVPDNLGPYTVTLDVVRNVPTGSLSHPVALADCYFEGGVAVLEALYSYAQFLALFKEGALQAQQAAPLMNRFLAAAGVTEALDQASVPDRSQLFAQSRNDERALPRLVTPETDQ